MNNNELVSAFTKVLKENNKEIESYVNRIFMSVEASQLKLRSDFQDFSSKIPGMTGVNFLKMEDRTMSLLEKYNYIVNGIESYEMSDKERYVLLKKAVDRLLSQEDN